ncbi:hypothetical protein M011DRAFT_481782 [Sporormia fimetaria CBS 119925]|uniref:Uncharacterized protein n=1 Tax=Sporormia fimetaria CBS 119925 TaxID=1340428 RepID=A0A6A6UVK5_9PLEO|nr:hypothetical protein M011DRAFT_481782 [Sporormia fimetaria CBS 119925]
MPVKGDTNFPRATLTSSLPLCIYTVAELLKLNKRNLRVIQKRLLTVHIHICHEESRSDPALLSHAKTESQVPQKMLKRALGTDLNKQSKEGYFASANPGIVSQLSADDLHLDKLPSSLPSPLLAYAHLQYAPDEHPDPSKSGHTTTAGADGGQVGLQDTRHEASPTCKVPSTFEFTFRCRDWGSSVLSGQGESDPQMKVFMGTRESLPQATTTSLDEDPLAQIANSLQSLSFSARRPWWRASGAGRASLSHSNSRAKTGRTPRFWRHPK